MSEYQELIKNFERIRDYMRQFFVYGFKVRGDYKGKSARTYDNERRRIESFLTGYTRSEYTAKGKKIYINVDSKTIPKIPCTLPGSPKALQTMILCCTFSCLLL